MPKKKYDNNYGEANESFDLVPVDNSDNDIINASQADRFNKLRRAGNNSRYTSRALLLWKQPKVTSMEEFNKRLCDYFEYCIQTDYKPSVESMALALGIDRRTFWTWSVGERAPFGEEGELQEGCLHAKAVLNALLSDFMMNGQINPVTGIFLLKNNFGYTDEVVQVTIDANDNKPRTAAEIAQAIANDIPDD